MNYFGGKPDRADDQISDGGHHDDHDESYDEEGQADRNVKKRHIASPRRSGTEATKTGAVTAIDGLATQTRDDPARRPSDARNREVIRDLRG